MASEVRYIVAGLLLGGVLVTLGALIAQEASRWIP